jgi:hypothetical protein
MFHLSLRRVLETFFAPITLQMRVEIQVGHRVKCPLFNQNCNVSTISSKIHNFSDSRVATYKQKYKHTR